VPVASVANAVLWSTMAQAADNFDQVPRNLSISSGSNTLWMIDTVTHNLVTYMDTLADVSIELVSPTDGYQNAMNPVTGQSVDIAFSWTKPSDNVIGYDVRIYNDADGNAQIAANNGYAPAGSPPNPVLIMGPYQVAPNLIVYVPGETYYWRVRTNAAAATGPIESPWSEMRSFTIEPAQALVAQISSPVNGGQNVGLTPAFSWSPVAGATEYEFQLAAGPSEASFASAVSSETLAGTGYRPVVILDEGTTYFWRIRAVTPVLGGWSAVANFTTMTTPEAAAPPVVIETMPAPIINIPAAPPATEFVIPPTPAPDVIGPGYIWAIIVIGAILVIVVIVLIVRTRRPV